MQLDTVLLELEGVLADTAAARRSALRAGLAAESGHVLDDAALACGDGLVPRDAAAAVARAASLDLDDTALDLAALRAEREFAAASERGVSLVPGARAFVERLAGSARVGIVTRAARRDAERVLALADLEYAAELLVTADDRVAPKPDPAPYALALARLARRRPVARDRVLALEDGAPGIASATAAGLAVLAVGDVPAHVAMRAAGVLPSLDGASIETLQRVAGQPVGPRA